MRYDICSLYDGQFEKLVIGICQKTLGIRVQHFSTGPDGGRDARFEGQSIEFNATGKFIIQAKHTTNPIAKYSDNEFSCNESSAINSEIPRIKKLYDTQQLDYYILFSNRKLSGEAENTVREKISFNTGMPSNRIHCIGIEMIDDYLKKFPEIPEQYGVDFFFSTLF
ncbi:MAG: restriction endonuclease, partial [Candidatus Cloacimonadaceae bacterium]|nr:restriction endonuclease [Candidatus Cloacimonadaceae bacterium]